VQKHHMDKGDLALWCKNSTIKWFSRFISQHLCSWCWSEQERGVNPSSTSW